MSDNTLTRLGICEQIYQQIGLSRKDSLDIVQNIIEKKSNSLANGNDVKLSSFGTFSVHAKNERVGRNPKTGVEAVITPRRVLSFRPSNLMKKKINAG